MSSPAPQERRDPPVTTRTATAAGDEDGPRARLVRLLARRAEAQAEIRLGDWVLAPADASRLLSAIDDQEGEGCEMTTVAEADVLWPTPYVPSRDRHEELVAAIHERHVALRSRLERLAGEAPREKWPPDVDPV